MFVKMGPDGDAGGGGAAGGAAAGAGNGAGAGVEGAAAGAGAAGTEKVVGKGAGAGQVAKPPPVQQPPAFHEWEEDDGKGGKVKRRESFDALITAKRREAALNTKFREWSGREQKIAEAEERLAREAEIRERGDVRALLGKDFKGSRIEVLAKALREEVLHDRQLSDPQQRALLEKADEADQLREELTGIKRSQAQAQAQAEVDRHIEERSGLYQKAFEPLGLPKNDVTVSWMAGAERAARAMNLKLTPEALAAETKRVGIEQMNGLTKGMTPAQALEAFPDLTRLIHQGLIERSKGRSTSTQAQQLKPKDKGEGGDQKKPEEMKVMNNAEIRKQTGFMGI